LQESLLIKNQTYALMRIYIENILF